MGGNQPNETEKLVLVDVDPVVVIITLIHTMTFYPLLYLSYSYIYKGTEDKDAIVVLYNVILVAQFEIIRDLLFIVFALAEYGGGLFKDTVSDTGNYDAPFIVLDVVLWILTIVLLVPIIVIRLNRPKD